ncbi:hypothetical protein FHG87_025444 [Trinorchestia longiramus]|nr:hypothetical protein FHG87_025444 [Trinorchestia longiramus]
MSKFTVCHGLGNSDRHRKISACFCAMCGQTELRKVHFSYLKSKLLPWATEHFRIHHGVSNRIQHHHMAPPHRKQTERTANKQRKHCIFHKQRCMTSEEFRPQSLRLFYLIHFGDKDFSYPSHFSRVPQSKTTTGVESSSTRTDTCCLR